MKKAVVLFAILFLVAGFVSALTLSDSTFVVGGGYDYFHGGGNTLSDASEFNSGLKSFSLYGCYDVKVGNKMFSRIEYCLYVMTRSFDFGGNVPGEHAVLKPSKHNKRVGGFVSLNIGKKGHINLGGAVADITMKLTDNDTGEEYTRNFLGVGLILEGQFDFNDHFSLRLGVSPDFVFFAVDSYERSDKDGYSISEKRGAFCKGYSVGARLGVAYKF